MAYQSEHTGTIIDTNISAIPDLQTQINELNTLINSLNSSISTINTNITNLQSKDTSLQSSINNIESVHNTDISSLQTLINNIQEPWTGTAILQSNTISPSSNFSYTATQNCIAYITFWLQANQSGNIQISINNVDIVNISTGEAIASHLNTIPIFLQTGDILYVYQNSNETGRYTILSLK